MPPLRSFLMSGLAFACLTSVLFAGWTGPFPDASSPQSSLAGTQELIIKRRSGHSVEDIQRLYAQNGVFVKSRLSAIGLDFCSLTPQSPPWQVMPILRLSKLVEFVEPDYRVAPAGKPNDPLFREQWWLHNAQDKDIDAPESWALFKTQRDRVIVAVIDTGIDRLHPDLSASVWHNDREIPGNGIDDDANGYADDETGWNFWSNTADVTDWAGHGTHVSGMIAAVNNNGIGVAGISGAARIMPLKFIHTWYGLTSDAIRAIVYAADMGAGIINASWGGGDDSQAMKEAIRYAGDKGVLFVAAAGNWSINTDRYPFYPASYRLSNVLSMAATDSLDHLAWFSNYGRTSVHLAAPGDGILSTFPGGGYVRFSGTSMAAPVASAIASIVLSCLGPLQPADVIRLLARGSEPIADFEGKMVYPRRLNARNCTMPFPVRGDVLKFMAFLAGTSPK